MKRFSMILTLVLISLFLTSCWSRRELDELAITTGLAVDKIEDKYLVTAQILNPGEIAGQEQTSILPVTTFSTTGDTIFEAIRKQTLKSPRKLYLSHIRIIIFGEELAREGLKEALDFFSRDHQMRTDFYIAIAKGQRASDILKVITPIEKIPTMKIFNSIEEAESAWAPAKGVQLDELISKIVSEGINPVLTGVYVHGPKNLANDLNNVEKVDSPGTIEIDHLAAFKEDKLVGWLEEDDSKAIQYIENNVENTIGTVPCKDGILSVEIIDSNSSVEAMVENGKPKIKVILKSEGNIGEVQCAIDLSKEESLEEISSKVEEGQEKMIRKSIEKAQKWKVDIFGFGEAVHRANPKAWKTLSKNWDEHFQDLEVDIEVSAEIKRLGTITESFQ